MGIARNIRPRLADASPLACGALTGVALYLALAAGRPLVPFSALDFAVFVALASPLAALPATNAEGRWTRASLIWAGAVFAAFCVVGAPVLLLAGMPGSNFAMRSDVDLFLSFPFMTALLVVLRRPKGLTWLIASATFCFAATTLVVRERTTARMQQEIDATRARGGTTRAAWFDDGVRKGEWRPVDAVPSLGVIVGARSPRVQFLREGMVFEWRYSRFESDVCGRDPCAK